MTDRSDYPTRKLSLRTPQSDDTAALEPSERLALVWPLTLQAWAFKGLQHEPRLRRDVAALCEAGAEFLIIGAHAVAVHSRVPGNVE